MSTNWGYQCNSHTPPLTDAYFLNHGQDTLEKALENRELIIAMLDSSLDVDYPNYIWWLHAHPKCDVVIVNEYGLTLEEYNNRSKNV
jgi:hypothetical protein